jgi:hypothetical protein
LLNKLRETSTKADDIKVAVEAIQRSRNWRDEINAGEQRIREIRLCLDDTIDLGSESEETPGLVETFPSFDAWLASFSGTREQEQEDEQLLREFKTDNLGLGESTPQLLTPRAEETTRSEYSTSTRINLIITNLRKPGSQDMLVEQLSLPLSTEIREVLRILKNRGMSLWMTHDQLLI